MKEYKQPQIEIYECMDNIILAGSLEAKTGKTSEQLAKKGNTTDFDDFEDYEDFEDEEFELK